MFRKIKKEEVTMGASRKWNTNKLDELLTQICESFVEHQKEDESLNLEEDEQIHQLIGFWMYRLNECQDGELPLLRGTGGKSWTR